MVLRMIYFQNNLACFMNNRIEIFLYKNKKYKIKKTPAISFESFLKFQKQSQQC